MVAFRLHDVELVAEEEQVKFRLHDVAFTAVQPEPVLRFRLHAVSLSAGEIPSIGPGGVWVRVAGQTVKHRIRYWLNGEHR